MNDFLFITQTVRENFRKKSFAKLTVMIDSTLDILPNRWSSHY